MVMASDPPVLAAANRRMMPIGWDHPESETRPRKDPAYHPTRMSIPHARATPEKDIKEPALERQRINLLQGCTMHGYASHRRHDPRPTAKALILVDHIKMASRIVLMGQRVLDFVTVPLAG